MKNLPLIIIFFILLTFFGLLIWPPLGIIFPVLFFLKFWKVCETVSFGDYAYPSKQDVSLHDLIRCRACKTYWIRSHLEEHVLQAVIAEQQTLKSLHFPQFVLPRKFHAHRYHDLLKGVITDGKEREIFIWGNTKAIIKGSEAKIIRFGSEAPEILSIKTF